MGFDVILPLKKCDLTIYQRLLWRRPLTTATSAFTASANLGTRQDSMGAARANFRK